MYLLLKFLHIVALVMFLGNIAAAMVWLRDANRSRDPGIIAHTLHGVIVGDRWITLPSAAFVFGTGFALAMNAQLPILRTGWIWQSLLAFALSGVLYAYPIDPLQRRMRALALAATQSRAQMDWARYRRMARAWYVLGFLSIALLVGVIALMVFKPR